MAASSMYIAPLPYGKHVCNEPYKPYSEVEVFEVDQISYYRSAITTLAAQLNNTCIQNLPISQIVLSITRAIVDYVLACI